ncbi:MATE efflux family protein [Klebsormidium nitens]|uniref:Protein DETOXIFICATION n=1 Tax=Klebsormidium nitens TaxID=105231 RepID=A0A1Y1IRF5_KLENI|nr:MATE efflux family protein [Klebsormidium nitens]|eukprot:GAQ91217.1 MATE efflux family protein [Klebsormidium nitens]
MEVAAHWVASPCLRASTSRRTSGSPVAAGTESTPAAAFHLSRPTTSALAGDRGRFSQYNAEPLRPWASALPFPASFSRSPLAGRGWHCNAASAAGEEAGPADIQGQLSAASFRSEDDTDPLLVASDAVGGPRIIHQNIGGPLQEECPPATSNGHAGGQGVSPEGALAEPGPEAATVSGREGDLTASILAEIRQLALPALGSCLADPLMSLIDSCCVGQIGSVQLASLGPNTAIFNFVFQVFGFLGISTTSMLASLSASGSGTPAAAQHKAARTLSVALTLALLLGVLALVVLEWQGVALLRAMGASPELLGPGLAYLRIRALSAPAVLVLVVGQGACLGCQDARTPLFIFLGAGLLNVVGDILLTLHWRWGVRGAAWATVVAQYCGAAVFLYTLADRLPLLPAPTAGAIPSPDQASSSPADPRAGVAPGGRTKGAPRRVRRVGPPFRLQWGAWPSDEEMRALAGVGGTLVMRSLCGMVVYTLLAYAATSLGTLHIAAHQVSMQLFWFLSYFPEPLSISAQSLVARDLAAEPQRARAMARMLLWAGCGIGLVLGVVVWAVPRVWGHVLAADVAVRRGVVAVSAQNAVCSWLCALAVVLDGVAIGSGDYGYMPRMQFLNMLGVGAALRTAWAAGWGLPGVWHCLTLFFVLRIAYHAVHIANNRKTHVLGW